MPLDTHQVGKRLTEIREIQGRSLSEVAEDAGIAKSYLFKLERGEVDNPGLATLDAVAKALKTTLARLLAPPDKSGSHRSTTEPTWESVDARMPDTLREFIQRREGAGEKIPADLKQALSAIRLRGAQPQRPEDWELIYLAVKRGVERG